MSMNSTAQKAFAQLPSIQRRISKFNRSYSKKMNNAVDYLIPVMALDVQPGDIVDLGVSVYERILNLKVPPMDGLKEKFFFFYVPYRIIWDHWPEFYFSIDLAKEYNFDPNALTFPKVRTKPRLHSMIDYFGGCPISDQDGGNCEKAIPIDALKLRAYNMIYNNFARVENIDDVLIENRGDDGTDDLNDYKLRKIRKELDIFTTCLPWAQKGDPVELPIGGTVAIEPKETTQLIPVKGGKIEGEIQPLKMVFQNLEGNLSEISLGLTRQPIANNMGNGALERPLASTGWTAGGQMVQNFYQNISQHPENTAEQNGVDIGGNFRDFRYGINKEVAVLNFTAAEAAADERRPNMRGLIWGGKFKSNQTVTENDIRYDFTNGRFPEDAANDAHQRLFGRPLSIHTNTSGDDLAGTLIYKHEILGVGKYGGSNSLNVNGDVGAYKINVNNQSHPVENEKLYSFSPEFSQNTRIGLVDANLIAPQLQGNLNNATSITINDFRQLVLQQRFDEAMARAGAGRIEEVLYTIWGVDIGMNVIQKPEYLGGFTANWMFQTIAQTGASTEDSPQGNLTAQAILQTNNFCFRKAFKEHGVVIGLKVTKGDLSYSQGNSWQNMRRTVFDLYNPMFAGAGEQAIYTDELYCTGNESEEIEEKEIFGYNEYGSRERYHVSEVCGDFRPLKNPSNPEQMQVNYANWCFSQYFEDKPTLSPEFMEQETPIENVLFNKNDKNCIVCNIFWKLKHYRQVPVYSTPGIDKI